MNTVDVLDAYLEEKSGEDNADFWTNNSLLKSHPDWEEIRNLAKQCLAAIGKENSILETKISNEITSTNRLLQRINIKILNKNK